MPDQLTVRPVDPLDDRGLAAWHSTYDLADRHGRAHAYPWALVELRAQLRLPDPGYSRRLLAGWAGDVLVSVAALELPLLDNTDQVLLSLGTHPEHRRHGHGTAMLEHVRAVASELGRTTVLTEVPFPLDGPADGAGTPGVEFAVRHGFSLALGDVQRELALPVDTALLAALVAEAERHHDGQRFRNFTGRVPDDLVVSFGRLAGSLGVEAPQGDLQLEPEVYSPERIRAEEVQLAASERVRFGTVALDDRSEVVAYSDIMVAGQEGDRAFQWGTLVAPEHRGRRLGLAVKARNLQHMQAACPSLRRLTTFNAEVNRHMVAVNDRLGFRPVERMGEFQLRL